MAHTHSLTHAHTHTRRRSIAQKTNRTTTTKIRLKCVPRSPHEESVEKVPNSIQFACDCSSDNNRSSSGGSATALPLIQADDRVFLFNDAQCTTYRLVYIGLCSHSQLAGSDIHTFAAAATTCNNNSHFFISFSFSFERCVAVALLFSWLPFAMCGFYFRLGSEFACIAGSALCRRCLSFNRVYTPFLCLFFF